MKKILFSFLLVCSLATVVSAKQTAYDFVSLLTDWCQTDSETAFGEHTLTIVTSYVECGGTKTKIRVQVWEI